MNNNELLLSETKCRYTIFLYFGLYVLTKVDKNIDIALQSIPHHANLIS